MKSSAGQVHSLKLPEIRRVVLIINPKKQKVWDLCDEITKELKSLGIETDIIPVGGTLDIGSEKGCGLAISLGGDGTVLSAARTVSPLGIPVFAVNLGTFGFIAGIQPHEWRKVFKRCLEGKALFSRRLMLEISVERSGGVVFEACCLNDVVFSAEGISAIINLRLSCSDRGSKEFIKLGSYHSSGLIVSTPTGSTAYSAAAGGPIVDPELEAMILNPICPFTLIHRPMVLPAVETIMVEVDEEQRSALVLTVDGQVNEKLENGDRIYLKKAPFYCHLVASGRRGFYQALRTKLAWAGEDPAAARIAGGESHD
ncbi:MAG: NAD(+)/NADH kinase [Treponema sp.]|jgi:NAD+ kinase|nr:NAD(+)/NADH kinase [Treponema sp.]